MRQDDTVVTALQRTLPTRYKGYQGTAKKCDRDIHTGSPVVSAYDTSKLRSFCLNKQFNMG